MSARAGVDGNSKGGIGPDSGAGLRLELIVVADKCTGCGTCVEACPVQAIRVESDTAVIDPGLCLRCTSCVPVCEPRALLIPIKQGAFVLGRATA